jgi:tRNA threonylcarbamoyl adenosine modification protein (Sua5/YciO/YrdC/YwlC family)
MAAIYDCSVPTELLTGMRLARAALGKGELVVIPTDTVYGLAADAFDPRAVQRLLDAKGRTRQSPPPVLIPALATLEALATDIPESARSLVAEFWPGGLTLILRATPSLMWDLGDTNGTVALRMPSDPLALELLADTGPLAVSSANLTGEPAATTAHEAEAMLGESVTVYLDAGARQDATASSIVDATSADGLLRIVRHGAVSDERLRAVAGDLLAPETGT